MMIKNIIAAYNAADLGLEVDFGVAYLNEDDGYYWWLDSTHHEFSRVLGIYDTQKEAEEALKNWATKEEVNA